MKIDSQEDIEPSYSLSIAVEDFKQGVQLYQNRNLKAAYTLIQKALLRFEIEKQYKLVMESTYLIANILFQMEKFKSSTKYFEKLTIIAQNLQHEKYIELSSFMLAYCMYKNKNYKDAFEIFENNINYPIKFVNPLQFFTFRARTCSKLGYREQAIEYYNDAIEICEKSPDGKQVEAQLAQLFYDLGLEHYYKILNELKASGFSYYDDFDQWSTEFSQSINYFLKTIKIWEKIGEIRKIITIYQIMGNIYGYIKDYDNQIEYYEKALHKSEEANEFEQYIKISRMLIRVLTGLHRYNDLIKLIQKIISVLNQNGVNDLLSIGEFHLKLGKIHVGLKDPDSALLEFITALHLYQRLKIPILEHKTTLEQIIQIYKNKNDKEKISYYSQQLSDLNNKLHELIIPQENWSIIIKDFWVITDIGIEIFSYTPEVSINPTLFGGFISALQSLSEEISKKKMESFVIGNFRYSFYYEENKPFFIIGRADVQEMETKVIKVLSILYRRFYKEYSKYLHKFSGNVSPFQNFGKIIKTIDFNLV
ncbi:MAG: hypothetical protein DRO88_13815 [Promethearchaeia archaeon]|nr:MAG: hypothetical protein DRO88_13815 [Candidatus Lokiarchaeia archaeon]